MNMECSDQFYTEYHEVTIEYVKSLLEYSCCENITSYQIDLLSDLVDYMKYINAGYGFSPHCKDGFEYTLKDKEAERSQNLVLWTVLSGFIGFCIAIVGSVLFFKLANQYVARYRTSDSEPFL